MANKEEMLKVIYEKIARKDLSFGCKVKTEFWYDYIFICNDEHSNTNVLTDFREWSIDTLYWRTPSNMIIWHPVMIWDVLDTLRFNFATLQEKVESILYHWEEKREPIENQSDECIEYVYNLAL